MPKLPTTGRISWKPYRCQECGTETERQTNHWGECYPWCDVCGTMTVHECMEPTPKGMGRPAPWKLTTLGEVATIIPGWNPNRKRGGHDE